MIDLFRYHGFWSIGVRLFRNMSFLSKALVISALFLAGVAQFAGLFVMAGGSAIAQARGELAGLAEVRARVAQLARARDEDSGPQLRQLERVVDDAGLALDPDAASHHLALGTLELAELQGRLAHLQGHGAALPAGDAQGLQEALERVNGRLARVVRAAPELAGALPAAELQRSTKALLDAARATPPGEVGPLAAAAAGAAAALNQAGADTLATRVAARVQQLQWRLALQLGMAALGLLTAAYFFYCFYLVTRGGMEEVTRHIDALAEGDLTTEPRPWGRDEAASLMMSIARMQASLRGLIGEVRSCAGVIAEASSEVAGGARDLSARTEHSAGSLQRTATSMEQIAGAVRATAQRTDESAALGQENARVAGEGGRVIEQVISTMQGIRESSARIAEITAVIDGIAFQTNILALNAAVESARAGEHGRGFAVVAGEVRALAQRSAQAAREIRGLVTASAEQTAQGAQVVGAAGQTMGRLVGNAQAMSTLLAEISSAAGEQTRGVGEVGTAVAELDQDTQQNAALVQQTSAAAASMQQRADELVHLADRFRLPQGA